MWAGRGRGGSGGCGVEGRGGGGRGSAGYQGFTKGLGWEAERILCTAVRDTHRQKEEKESGAVNTGTRQRMLPTANPSAPRGRRACAAHYKHS